MRKKYYWKQGNGNEMSQTQMKTKLEGVDFSRKWDIF